MVSILHCRSLAVMSVHLYQLYEPDQYMEPLCYLHVQE